MPVNEKDAKPVLAPVVWLTSSQTLSTARAVTKKRLVRNDSQEKSGAKGERVRKLDE